MGNRDQGALTRPSEKKAQQMTEPRHLDAYASRDGKWWTIKIPALTAPAPNGKTGVAIGGTTKFREIGAAARDLAAAWLDVDESEVKVDVNIEIPEEARTLWIEAVQMETKAREDAARAASLRRAAVRMAHDEGYTLDAVAAAFDISKQRAHQLSKEPIRERADAS